MSFRSFDQFAEAVVLPGKAANPTYVRLDGERTGGNWEVAGVFEQGGRSWKVHSDSHFEPLLVAYRASRAGDEPFVEAPTRGSRRKLVLKPELHAKLGTRYQYVYIYG